MVTMLRPRLIHDADESMCAYFVVLNIDIHVGLLVPMAYRPRQGRQAVSIADCSAKLNAEFLIK